MTSRRLRLSRLRRLLAVSSEYERALLSSLIGGNGMDYVAGKIKARDFEDSRHANLFSIIEGIYEDGQTPDHILLAERIGMGGRETACGGFDYVSDIISLDILEINAPFYSQLVREGSISRGVKRVALQIQSREDLTGRELLDWADAQLQDVGAESSTDGVDFTTLVDGVMEAACTPREAAKKGILTGLTPIDHLTNGLQRGELSIIAGRPSMGKSSLAYNIASRAAVDGYGVGIWSLEVGEEQIAMNIMGLMSETNARAIRMGGVDKAKINHMGSQAERIHKHAMTIFAPPELTPASLRADARKCKRKHGLDLVIIDYLQLMDSGKKSEGRQGEITYISRQLKALAREMNCHVLALSQLNREVERRDDKHPKMSDLRESGSIEQDADLIGLIYRDWYYTRNEATRTYAELNIAKHRNGPTQTLQLLFEDSTLRFSDPKPVVFPRPTGREQVGQPPRGRVNGS